MPINGRADYGSYDRVDELIAARFCIDIDNFLVGVFTGCTGLTGDIEVETYQEGGLNDYEHKLPGRAKYGNVTLKGGVFNAVYLWEWFHSVAAGKVERRDVSVVMYKQNEEEALRWNLSSAYPVKWQGPDFAAGDTNASVHSVELAHRGVTLNRA